MLQVKKQKATSADQLQVGPVTLIDYKFKTRSDIQFHWHARAHSVQSRSNVCLESAVASRLTLKAGARG